MIEIVNRQRKVRVDPREYREFAEQAARLIPGAEGRGLTIAFVSDSRIRKLNKTYRGVDASTDVLSFLMDEETDGEEDYIGDIAISVETAERQALGNGLDLPTEIRQLVLHGMLHLCGWDHATDSGEMDAFELELRDRLSIT
jgi:probable rRNA maturation factor